jgi:hypothetical protein
MVSCIAMLVLLLPIVQGLGRPGQERGPKPRSQTGTIFRLTRPAPASYPAAYHYNRRQEQRVSAAHPRPEAPPRAGGAGDLGPATAESSARGRAGSPLYHVPSAPPPWRVYSRQACMQKETGIDLPLSPKADSHRRAPLPAKASAAAVAGTPRWPPARRVCTGPAARREDPPHRHHAPGSMSKCYATLEKLAVMGNPGPRLSHNFLVARLVMVALTYWRSQAAGI